MSNRLRIITATLLLAIPAIACQSSGEQTLIDEINTASLKVQQVKSESDMSIATDAYQSAMDAISRYLDQYPNGASAGEMRDRLAKYSTELRSLREGTIEYQNSLKKELDLNRPQLPSDCQRMVDMWQGYLSRFPNTKNTDTTRQRKDRWDAKLKEETERGFQIVLEEAEIEQVKGSSHRIWAGHAWDPKIFGARMPPDPYAVLLINDQPVGYTSPARDTYRPVWRRPSNKLRVSDEQQVTIRVRDRDVAENIVSAAVIARVFGFSSLSAVVAALKRDNDDDICLWTGTIRDLMEASDKRLVNIDDCMKIRVRVIRPQ